MWTISNNWNHIHSLLKLNLVIQFEINDYWYNEYNNYDNYFFHKSFYISYYNRNLFISHDNNNNYNDNHLSHEFSYESSRKSFHHEKDSLNSEISNNNYYKYKKNK